jgi:hypothetical protein
MHSARLHVYDAYKTYSAHKASSTAVEIINMADTVAMTHNLHLAELNAIELTEC